MNNKVVALILCIFAVAIIGGCSSHSPPPPGLTVPTPEAKLEMLHARLQLTPDQMEAMRPILQEEFEENTYRVQSLENKDEKHRRIAVKRIHDEFQVREEITRDAFANILTPEQLNEYDRMIAEMKTEQGPMMDEEPPNGKRPSGGRGRPPRR